MKNNYKCGKKICAILSRLGYMGDLNYPAVSNWIMAQGLYIMPLPMPYWKWTVGVVTLGFPCNGEDNLDMIVVKDSVRSIDEAIRIGVDFVVSSLDEEMRKMEKTN